MASASPKAKAGSRVAVLMGGRSAEREVSLESGKAVLAALRARGWDAVDIDVGHDPCGQLAEARADVAYIALHGRYGEDGCIQGLLESVGMPYTGSSVASSAIAMDKVLTKRLLAGAGVPTPPWSYPASIESVHKLELPIVLKPPREGSSVGLYILKDASEITRVLSEARADHGALLAEQYIRGRELSVAVLGSEAEARALGTIEIETSSGQYDFEAKYESQATRYLCPTPINTATRLPAFALGDADANWLISLLILGARQKCRLPSPCDRFHSAKICVHEKAGSVGHRRSGKANF